MTIDWEARIEGKLYEEPTLIGLGTLYSLAGNNESLELTNDSSHGLWWNLFIMGSGILVIVTVLSLRVLRKKGG